MSKGPDPAQPAQRGQVLAHPASADARVARPAVPRWRHRLLAASFLLAVVLPGLGTLGYLYTVAADQYVSRVAFSVRSNDGVRPVEILGALTQSLGGSGGSTGDTRILYEFIRSQQMVEAAAAHLDFDSIFNRPAYDVVFRLGTDRAIEDVVDYWRWMTDVSYDTSTGIVQFEARAFDPESAHAITRFVLAESTRLVNELSRQAREDAVAVARDVLREAEDRLRTVRRNMRVFRSTEQALDPSEDARATLGLTATLEEDLARTQIELDSQLKLVGERSPRISVLRQRIASLEARIRDERTRLGAGRTEAAEADRVLADTVADYEDLVVDREFAENAYVSALASFEQSQIEARRQMRYLAPHIQPTLPATAEYPERALLALAVLGGLIAGWTVVVLLVYNVRERR